MLLTTVKPEETVRFINSKDPTPITLKVLESSPGRVRLGISAPVNVKIDIVRNEKNGDAQ